MLLMVSIFIHGSSQMPNDQVLNIVGKLLDRDHGTGNFFWFIHVPKKIPKYIIFSENKILNSYHWNFSF